MFCPNCGSELEPSTHKELGIPKGKLILADILDKKQIIRIRYRRVF